MQEKSAPGDDGCCHGALVMCNRGVPRHGSWSAEILRLAPVLGFVYAFSNALKEASHQPDWLGASRAAERFWEALRERLANFRLELHPEKSRLIAFGCIAQRDHCRGGVRRGRLTSWVSRTTSARRARASPWSSSAAAPKACGAPCRVSTATPAAPTLPLVRGFFATDSARPQRPWADGGRLYRSQLISWWRLCERGLPAPASVVMCRLSREKQVRCLRSTGVKIAFAPV